MRLRECQLTEGSLSFGEYSKPLGKGAIVDLDEVVGQRDGEPVLLEELLAGEPGLLHAFTEIPAPSADSLDQVSMARAMRQHDTPSVDDPSA